MARTAPESNAPEKEPGRLRQIWMVFQMTRRYDGTIVLWLLLAFILPIAASIVLSVVVLRDNVIGIILSSITGLLIGVLLVLIVLGRKAERAAFSLYGFLYSRPRLLALLSRTGRRVLSLLGPGPRRWLSKLVPGWTRARSLPVLTEQSFVQSLGGKGAAGRSD